MNIAWHIIQKDLRRIVWLLAIWFACGIGVALPSFKLNTAALYNGNSGFFLPVILLITYGVTTVALIVDIIHDDHPMRNAFWRTRPVSPVRLLGAKLLLLAVLFGLVPLLTQYGLKAVLHGSEPLVPPGSGEMGWSMNVLSTFLPTAAAVLILAAIAACSLNGGRFILIVIACWASASALSMALGHLEMAQLPRQMSRSILPTKLLAMALYGCSMAVAVLWSQYLGRRTVLSYLGLGAGVVGIAVISVLWRWPWT